MKCLGYDNYVICCFCVQETVFAEVRPLVHSCLDGYNACIFAYGQVTSHHHLHNIDAARCDGCASATMETMIGGTSNNDNAAPGHNDMTALTVVLLDR